MDAEKCPDCGAWMDYHIDINCTWEDPISGEIDDTGERQEQVHRWICTECGFAMITKTFEEDED